MARRQTYQEAPQPTTRLRVRYDRLALAVATGLLLAALGAWAFVIATDEHLPPCEYEDSDNCYWDADTMGNGEGHSFIVRDGVVTYTDS